MKVKHEVAALTLVGLNLLAMSSTIDAIDQSSSAEEKNQEIGAINQKSLSSIEASWLKLPKTCKAAGFNAEPNPIEREPLSRNVADIYRSFGVSSIV